MIPFTNLDKLAPVSVSTELAETPSQGAADRRLLIVDDDESVRQIVAALLSDEGYETATAATADEALESLRT